MWNVNKFVYGNLIACISVVTHLLVYGILACYQHVTLNPTLENKFKIMYHRQMTYDNGKILWMAVLGKNDCANEWTITRVSE